MPPRWSFNNRLPGLVLGLSIPLVVCALFARGVFDHIEFPALDAHFRWFGHIPASQDIVHIDITDQAIEETQRWPWPRDMMAGIVSALDEAGARLIVLDLLLPEPQPPDVRVLAREPYVEFEEGFETKGRIGADNWIATDKILAAAMGRAGNVLIAVSYSADPSTIQSEVGLAIAESLRAPRSFGLSASAIADRIHASIEAVEAKLPGVKRRVAMDLLDQRLRDAPNASFRQVHEELLSTPFEQRTADRADLKAAYARSRAVQHLLRKWPLAPATLEAIHEIDDHGIVPPYHRFAEQVRQIGFVNFTREQVGGVVRSQQLMVRYRGRLVRQLGFAAACEVLGIGADDLSIDASGDLVIRAGKDHPAARIQLNERGEMLINWHVAPTVAQSFQHISASEILEIHSARQSRAENIRYADQLRGEIVDNYASDNADRAAYGTQVAELDRLRAQLRDLRLDPDEAPATLTALGHRVDQAREALAELAREPIGLITMSHEFARDQKPRDDVEKTQLSRLREAYANVRVLESLPETNEKLDREIQAGIESLRERVAGRICIVGHAATGLADLVVTPPFEYAPGALVHGNIANTFLQNAFLRRANRATVTTVIALLGAVTVLVTLFVGPLRSLFFVLSAMGLYFVIHGAVVFGRFHVWVAAATPIAVMFISWAFVTLYRQLTEARTKRIVAKALAQYTSPAIARSIVQASVDFRPRQGWVTCFFTDLVAFTTISERLGPERTRAILNPYLESTSTVLIEHRAMINKFIGDAVFAFFNPPLLPCPAHADHACAAGLDAVAALQRLKNTPHEPQLHRDIQQLSMRVGINTGPVFVGDYGSESKLDYTCIGDTVNVAARLEPANKIFGTRVMISENTYHATDGCFEVRHLGGLQVVGRQQVVQVYELLGREGELADEPRRYADAFGRAVIAFQRHDFVEAERAFLACLELRADDYGAKRYLGILRRHETAPPSEAWNGSIALTEK